MQVTVWVDGWQMQCCGEPFAAGQEVSWLLSDEVDTDFLADVTDAQTSQLIRLSYEHHGRLPEDAPPTTGRILHIQAVHSRYAPAAGGDDRTLHPVPGSGHVVVVDSADGWEAETASMHFTGYVVELDVPDIGM